MLFETIHDSIEFYRLNIMQKIPPGYFTVNQTILEKRPGGPKDSWNNQFCCLLHYVIYSVKKIMKKTVFSPLYGYTYNLQGRMSLYRFFLRFTSFSPSLQEYSDVWLFNPSLKAFRAWKKRRRKKFLKMCYSYSYLSRHIMISNIQEHNTFF